MRVPLLGRFRRKPKGSARTPARPVPRDAPLVFRSGASLSKSERDMQRTQWAVLATFAALSVIVIVGAIGAYVNIIRSPRLPVATINGVEVSRADWQHYQVLLTAELQGQANQLQSQAPPQGDIAAEQDLQAQLNQIQQQLSGVGDAAVNDLINQAVVTDTLPALIQQGAPKDQIVPTAQQIDDAVKKEQALVGMPTTQAWKDFLSKTGYSDAQVRQVLTVRLEQDNIKAYLSGDIQASQPQVKARIMSFADAVQADGALAELKSGTAWTTVNVKYAKDPAAKETSQDVDWTPKGLEGATFDQFAFGAKPFQISDVLSNNGQHEIIQVEDVAPNRVLSTTQLDSVKTKAYDDWLAKATADAQVRRFPENMS